MTAKLRKRLATIAKEGGFSPSRPGDLLDLAALERSGYVEKAGPGLWKVSQAGEKVLSAKEAVAK